MLSTTAEDNLLGLGSSFLLLGFDRASGMVINEFMIYSLHIGGGTKPPFSDIHF